MWVHGDEYHRRETCGCRPAHGEREASSARVRTGPLRCACRRHGSSRPSPGPVDGALVGPDPVAALEDEVSGAWGASRKPRAPRVRAVDAHAGRRRAVGARRESGVEVVVGVAAGQARSAGRSASTSRAPPRAASAAGSDRPRRRPGDAAWRRRVHSDARPWSTSSQLSRVGRRRQPHQRIAVRCSGCDRRCDRSRARSGSPTPRRPRRPGVTREDPAAVGRRVGAHRHRTAWRTWIGTLVPLSGRRGRALSERCQGRRSTPVRVAHT